MTERMNVSGVGEVSNSDASKELLPAPGPTLYLYIESLGISISRAATGGGGEVIVLDTAGAVVWRTNADGAKDFSVPCGEEGLRIGPGVGLMATVANASGEQATASVSMTGHLAFR